MGRLDLHFDRDDSVDSLSDLCGEMGGDSIMSVADSRGGPLLSIS